MIFSDDAANGSSNRIYLDGEDCRRIDSEVKACRKEYGRVARGDSGR